MLVKIESLPTLNQRIDEQRCTQKPTSFCLHSSYCGLVQHSRLLCKPCIDWAPMKTVCKCCSSLWTHCLIVIWHAHIYNISVYETSRWQWVFQPWRTRNRTRRTEKAWDPIGMRERAKSPAETLPQIRQEYSAITWFSLWKLNHSQTKTTGRSRCFLLEGSIEKKSLTSSPAYTTCKHP